MRTEQPYNPLDKKNLGVSVADAMLAQAVGPLPPAEKFLGAGIYALYYSGSYAGYKAIATADKEGKPPIPIYWARQYRQERGKEDSGSTYRRVPSSSTD